LSPWMFQLFFSCLFLKNNGESTQSPHTVPVTRLEMEKRGKRRPMNFLAFPENKKNTLSLPLILFRATFFFPNNCGSDFPNITPSQAQGCTKYHKRKSQLPSTLLEEGKERWGPPFSPPLYPICTVYLTVAVTRILSS